MIVWQLRNVLSQKRALTAQLDCFSNQDPLPEDLTIEFLSQCDEIFSICFDGNLRSNKRNYAFDIGIVEELNAVDAYKKFGGNALSEVIDYGSWRIPENLL